MQGHPISQFPDHRWGSVIKERSIDDAIDSVEITVTIDDVLPRGIPDTKEDKKDKYAGG